MLGFLLLSMFDLLEKMTDSLALEVGKDTWRFFSLGLTLLFDGRLLAFRFSYDFRLFF